MSQEIKTVPLESIRLRPDLSPRLDKESRLKQEDTAKLYASQPADVFPPVLIARSEDEALDNVLLGGETRLKAAKLRGDDTLKAIYVDVDSELDARVAAIEDNATHGQQLTSEEKRAAARELKKGGMRQKAIAAVLAVGTSTISDWLNDRKKKSAGKSGSGFAKNAKSAPPTGENAREAATQGTLCEDEAAGDGDAASTAVGDNNNDATEPSSDPDDDAATSPVSQPNAGDSSGSKATDESAEHSDEAAAADEIAFALTISSGDDRPCLPVDDPAELKGIMDDLRSRAASLCIAIRRGKSDTATEASREFEQLLNAFARKVHLEAILADVNVGSGLQ